MIPYLAEMFGLGPDADMSFPEAEAQAKRQPNNPEGINQHTYQHRAKRPDHVYGEDPE